MGREGRFQTSRFSSVPYVPFVVGQHFRLILLLGKWDGGDGSERPILPLSLVSRFLFCFIWSSAVQIHLSVNGIIIVRQPPPVGSSRPERSPETVSTAEKNFVKNLFFFFSWQVQNSRSKHRQIAERFSAKQPNEFSPNSRKPLKWWIISHIISLNRRRNDMNAAYKQRILDQIARAAGEATETQLKRKITASAWKQRRFWLLYLRNKNTPVDPQPGSIRLQASHKKLSCKRIIQEATISCKRVSRETSNGLFTGGVCRRRKNGGFSYVLRNPKKAQSRWHLLLSYRYPNLFRTTSVLFSW